PSRKRPAHLRQGMVEFNPLSSKSGSSAMNGFSDDSQLGDGLDSPQQNQRRLLKAFTLLAVLGVLALLICLMLPAVRTARPAAYRNQCHNNLKQIALALRNYEELYHALPPAYTTDSNGNALHSWRTLILPFLGERQLYESIDLAKPWD